MRRISFLLILGWLLPALLLGQGNLGQSGANFLQIGVDPRGSALGGAVTSVAEGAAALYWNPAGAISTQNMDLYFANTRWFLDTRMVFGGLTKKLGSLGVIGLSVTSFYMDETEITTEYASEGTGEYYRAGDLAAGLSFARSMTDRFTFGVTVKAVHEFIWNEEASQVAFDVGSLYKTDFHHLCIGMAVRNFSGKLVFSGKDLDRRLAEERERGLTQNPREERLTPEFRLPQVFQLGVSFAPIYTRQSRLTMMADAEVPSDNEERFILGAEWDLHGLACVRAAYRFNYDEGELSLGGGLHLHTGGVKATLDYGYANHGVFGGVHRFGFGFGF